MQDEVNKEEILNSDTENSSAEDISNENVTSEDIAEEQSSLPETNNSQDAAALLPLLQALLIASHEPVDLENLARATDCSQEIIAEALELLEVRLNDDSFGFFLAKVAKGYQLRTKAQYAKYIRVLKDEAPRKLSSAALETLAVVAYRQPVVKHDIDGIRGVDVMPTLKTLIERGLVQAVGHKDTVGHPVLYATTDEFLNVFGLNSLSDLPKIKELSAFNSEPGEKADSFINTEYQQVTEAVAQG